MEKEMSHSDMRHIAFMEDMLGVKFRFTPELASLIKKFLDTLGGRKQKIATLRYGLEGEKALSLEAISKILLAESQYKYGLSIHSIRKHLSDIRSNFWSYYGNYNNSLLANSIMQYAINLESGGAND